MKSESREGQLIFKRHSVGGQFSPVGLDYIPKGAFRAKGLKAFSRQKRFSESEGGGKPVGCLDYQGRFSKESIARVVNEKDAKFTYKEEGFTGRKFGSNRANLPSISNSKEREKP